MFSSKSFVDVALFTFRSMIHFQSTFFVQCEVRDLSPKSKCWKMWILQWPFSWACGRSSFCCVLARLPLSLSVPISSSYKDISHTRSGPTNMTSFNLQYFFIGPSLVAQWSGICPPIQGMQETWVQSLVGKIPWRRKWWPTPVFLPEKSRRQRSLVGYSPRGFRRVGRDLAKELDMT